MDAAIKTSAVKKEPLIRIAKRDALPLKFNILIRAIAVVAALLIDGLFIFSVTGENPFGVYVKLLEGTFGTAGRFLWAMESLARLLLVALALAPAFKMKFWNIGGEGQVLIGALWSAMCMIELSDKMPSWLLLIVMLLGAVAAGAFWGLLPAFFKAKWSTNETLFTLMMNYIAIQLVAYEANIWRGHQSSLGVINIDSHAGWLPDIFGTNSDSGVILIIVALLTVMMYIYLKYTKQGYEISVVGESERTARYAGINVTKVVLRTMAISGAICGLCGFLTVSGSSHTVSITSAGGRGFDAIIVAWLSKFNSFYMIAVSFLIVFLEKGASQISSTYNTMNDYTSEIISGIILFFIIGCEFFINYRLIFRHKATNGEAAK